MARYSMNRSGGRQPAEAFCAARFARQLNLFGFPPRKGRIASNFLYAKDSTPTRDIIVIGGSAGALEALRGVVAQLPADFPASVFVVIHTSATGPAALAGILERAGELPGHTATDGETVQRGAIVVAPPDRHMRLERGRVRVCTGPTVNRHRPAVDMLFRSAAQAYGPRVIGVLLSGYLDDGVAGLLAIRHHGGTTIVQEPKDALVPVMPQAALDAGVAEQTARSDELAQLLQRLVSGAAAPEVLPMKQSDRELDDPRTHGAPSVFTCPDCSGTLWQLGDGKLSRYTCRVGHSYSPEAFDDAQAESLERSLWAGLRALEERVALSDRMAENANRSGHDLSAENYRRRADELRHDAEVLRTMLSGDGKKSDEGRVA